MGSPIQPSSRPGEVGEPVAIQAVLRGATAPTTAVPGSLLGWDPGSAAYGYTIADVNLSNKVLLNIVNSDTAGTGTFRVYGTLDDSNWEVAALAPQDNATVATYATTAQAIAAASARSYQVYGLWRRIVIVLVTASGFTTGGITATVYNEAV